MEITMATISRMRFRSCRYEPRMGDAEFIHELFRFRCLCSALSRIVRPLPLSRS
jgi:hypothetical protein